MERYYSADLHLGHDSILKFQSHSRGNGALRDVQDHDDWIIDRINSRCRKYDVLVILGDIAFNLEGLHRLREVRCNLQFVLGNHDQLNVMHYEELGKVLPGLHRTGNHWLSHAPIHPCELRRRVNIHGHMHSQTVDDPRYINVGIDQYNNLISNSQIINHFNSLKEQIDELNSHD